MSLMDQVKKSYTTSQYYPFVQNIAIYLFTQEIIMRHLYVLGIVGICYLLTHKTPHGAFILTEVWNRDGR